MEIPILLSEALKAEAEAVARAAEGIVTETAFFQAVCFVFYAISSVLCACAVDSLAEKKEGKCLFLAHGPLT